MDFSGINVVDLTPSVLLGICILAIITGRLKPRKDYEDMVEDRDFYRSALQESELQNKDLMQVSSKIAMHVLEALPRPQETK